VFPDRGEQIRPPDVTDEQRITGQRPVGHLVAGVLVDQHADGLRGVPGGLPDLQDDLAQRDAFSIGQVPHRELRIRPGAEADPGPRRRRQFEVPGQEVGVEVGVDHPDDLQPVRLQPGTLRGYLEPSRRAARSREANDLSETGTSSPLLPPDNVRSFALLSQQVNT